MSGLDGRRRCAVCMGGRWSRWIRSRPSSLRRGGVTGYGEAAGPGVYPGRCARAVQVLLAIRPGVGAGGVSPAADVVAHGLGAPRSGLCCLSWGFRYGCRPAVSPVWRAAGTGGWATLGECVAGDQCVAALRGGMETGLVWLSRVVAGSLAVRRRADAARRAQDLAGVAVAYGRIAGPALGASDGVYPFDVRHQAVPFWLSRLGTPGVPGNRDRLLGVPGSVRSIPACAGEYRL